MKLPRPDLRSQRGLTLVELVISMVVISVALSGVLLLLNVTILHSSDPLIQHQALAIAESYLEEILLKPYSDPDGVAESGRPNFDNVADYNGLHDVGARNQFNALVGLNDYTVDVVVAADTLGLPAVSAWRVDVKVTHRHGFSMNLRGYRTDY
ncbi:MAG: prepilin-type N-terminal cleavage/methylation domain-containing protein [Deltaproteobacteria bacterium]|nr:prepilin-type N-terminal cleavage/methylation domain-containing protein [Deltaproteobacteria bacterium]